MNCDGRQRDHAGGMHAQRLIHQPMLRFTLPTLARMRLLVPALSSSALLCTATWAEAGRRSTPALQTNSCHRPPSNNTGTSTPARRTRPHTIHPPPPHQHQPTKTTHHTTQPNQAVVGLTLQKRTKIRSHRRLRKDRPRRHTSTRRPPAPTQNSAGTGANQAPNRRPPAPARNNAPTGTSSTTGVHGLPAKIQAGRQKPEAATGRATPVPQAQATGRPKGAPKPTPNPCLQRPHPPSNTLQPPSTKREKTINTRLTVGVPRLPTKAKTMPKPSLQKQKGHPASTPHKAPSTRERTKRECLTAGVPRLPTRAVPGHKAPRKALRLSHPAQTRDDNLPLPSTKPAPQSPLSKH